MNPEPIIKTEDLAKIYKTGSASVSALRQVSLAFRRGEFAGLVGPSGSGKTTFLNIIGTLDKPSGGRAFVLGQDVSRLTPAQAAGLRSRHLGFIFQTANLLPVYTAYENVEFSLLLLGLAESERRKAALQALEWLGLSDKAGMRPGQLSGGECQRVAIARAMVKRPEIVLADEPSANLDAANTHHLLETMKRLSRELATTFIFATHDEKVMQYLDRTINLVDGKVESDVARG